MAKTLQNDPIERNVRVFLFIFDALNRHFDINWYFAKIGILSFNLSPQHLLMEDLFAAFRGLVGGRRRYV